MPHFPKPWRRPDRDLWYVTIHGKQYNLGRDRDKAFARYRDLLADAGKVPDGPISFADLSSAFLAWVRRERAAKTAKLYRGFLDSFSRRVGPSKLARDVTTIDVEAWVGSCPSWGANSRRRAISVVAHVFNWAVKRKLVAESPVEGVERPREKPRDRYLDHGEYEAVLDAVKANVDHHDFFTFLWHTGARPQEACLFEARHFDATARTLTLGRELAKGKRDARVVYLDDEAFAVVSRRVAKCPSPAARLFTNSFGGPWTSVALHHLCNRLEWVLAIREAKAAGLAPGAAEVERLTPPGNDGRRRKKVERELWESLAAPFRKPLCAYTFRHSFAVRLLTALVDPLTVATLMGHKSTDQLFKVYGHFMQAHDRMHEALRRASGRTPPTQGPGNS